MITTNTKYTRIKVSENRYEFRFQVFPEDGDAGIAVGYGADVKEARDSVNASPDFRWWYMDHHYKRCEKIYKEYGVERVEIETAGYNMWDKQGRRLVTVYLLNSPRCSGALWHPIEDALLSPTIGAMVEQAVAKERDRRARLGKTFELRKSVN